MGRAVELRPGEVFLITVLASNPAARTNVMAGRCRNKREWNPIKVADMPRPHVHHLLPLGEKPDLPTLLGVLRLWMTVVTSFLENLAIVSWLIYSVPARNQAFLLP